MENRTLAHASCADGRALRAITGCTPRPFVSHDNLWAPWRLGYIASQGSSSPQIDPSRLLPGADPACFLCAAAVTTDPRNDLVPHLGNLTVTVLNKFPYNNGHLLVAPRRHAGSLKDLTQAEKLECLDRIQHWIAVMEEAMQAKGFNVGLNLGAVAGAGVPGHLHWHVVPRWPGDVNFMPSLAGVKVLPQSLESLWELLSSRG